MRTHQRALVVAFVAIVVAVLSATPVFPGNDVCCPPAAGSCCPPGAKVVDFECSTVEECKAACEADLGAGYTVTTESVKPLRFRIRPATPESEASTATVIAKLAGLRSRRSAESGTDEPCCIVLESDCCSTGQLDATKAGVSCITEDLRRCVYADIRKGGVKSTDKCKRTYGPF